MEQRNPSVFVTAWVCLVEQRYHLNGRPYFCRDEGGKPRHAECGWGGIEVATVTPAEPEYPGQLGIDDALAGL